jgi:hypothetical protein
MFAVGPVLVSDALLDAAFACDVGACRGACCVVGERGAPLEEDEVQRLEDVLDVVRDELRPEARAVVDRNGPWEGDDRRGYATATVADRECVFVVYEQGRSIATCAIQRAHQAGRVDWEKPISCHLYPIRVERYGYGEAAIEVLNYEQIDLCAPGRQAGRRSRTALARYLERPLTRRYGAEWYARFVAAWRERRADLQVDDQLDDHSEIPFTLPILQGERSTTPA